MKRIVISIFLVPVAFCFAKGQDNAKVDSLIKVAKYRIENRDYYGAIKTLNNAIRIDPNNPNTYKQRAKAKNAIKEYNSALEDAHKSININKYFDAETYLILGRIYINMKEYENALGYINNAININPGYHEARNLKAMVYFFQGEYKEALNDIDKALEENAEYGDFHFTKGLILTYSEKYSRAIGNFNKALELSNTTNRFMVYLNRGICYLNLLNYEKALKDFNEAIALEPYNASAYHSRGRAYYEMEAYDAALNDFNKSIQIDESPVTYYNMGMSYFRLLELRNACMYFHKGCSSGSKNACKMVIQYCAGINAEEAGEGSGGN